MVRSPSPGVGQHSNPGIMPFGIIHCTIFPEYLRGLALKDRTTLAADKRDMSVCALKSRTNFDLNFFRLLSTAFRSFGAGNPCT
jgi:hypothetical protein